MSQYNDWFKRIRLSMQLTTDEAHGAVHRGGYHVSRSTVNGWGRAEDHWHYREMSEAEFDAFTRGLVDLTATHRKHGEKIKYPSIRRAIRPAPYQSSGESNEQVETYLTNLEQRYRDGEDVSGEPGFNPDWADD